MKEGWEYKTLSTVCKVQNGYAFDSKLFHDEKRGLPLIRIRDIKRGYSQTYTEETCASCFSVTDGDMLIGMDGDFNIGEWKGGRALLNQRVCKLIPSDKILAKFIFYFIPEALQKINSKTTFSTVKHLSSKQVEAIMLPILSLSEQQRIVEYLDSSFAKIDAMKANAEKALNEAKALFLASLKSLLEPKEGWEEKKLKQIGKTQTGTTPSKSDVGNYGDYIPFIRPSEINYDGTGALEYNSAMMLSEQGARNGRVFDPCSIFMVCIGATIGKVGFSDRVVSCNQQINILTPSDFVDHKFAYYFMSTSDFQRKVIKEGTSSQATLPIINKGKWEQLTISYPTLSEQRDTVTILDSIQSKISRLQSNFDKITQECDALKQALLKQVFE